MKYILVFSDSLIYFVQLNPLPYEYLCIMLGNCRHDLFIPLTSAAVPLPTFILGPLSTEHAQCYADLKADGGELCSNITCLGKADFSGMCLCYCGV